MVILTSAFVINQGVRRSFHALRHRHKTKQCKYPRILTCLRSRDNVHHFRRRISPRQGGLPTGTRAIFYRVAYKDGPTLLVGLLVVKGVDLQSGTRRSPLLGSGHHVRRRTIRYSKRTRCQSGVRLTHVIRGLCRSRFYLFRRGLLNGRITANVSNGTRLKRDGSLRAFPINCGGLFFGL